MATQTQAPIISPEVHADRTVAFRFNDPSAKKVEVYVEGQPGVQMTKNAGGIWTTTSPPLAPNIYGYTFAADGIAYLDPANPLRKPNLLWQSNLVLVPGSPAKPWELQRVPHGVVHRHTYFSPVINSEEDYYVYTPPGYNDHPRKRYPALYLLHGYSDSAEAWPEVGKANLILDNLIAQHKAKPMIVVMPLGYGINDFPNPAGFPNKDPERVKNNYRLFSKMLTSEIIPHVEKEYRASSSRSRRALAGLSMGGAETLYVGLNHLDRFAYLGTFSMGGLPEVLQDDFPTLDGREVNRALRDFHVWCGEQDHLIKDNRQLVSWLKSKGVRLKFTETEGTHEWPVWRRNLVEFVPALFR